MKNNKVSWLIGASTVAIIALVIIQVSWMRHSRQLIEEQFKRKVDMALCMAIDELAETTSCPTGNMCMAPGETQDTECGRELMFMLSSGAFDEVLNRALDYYNIHLPYTKRITSRESVEEKEAPLYFCSLCPLGTQTHVLQLKFEGKMGYILGKMGLMLFLSILILLFICTVFIMANYHLLKQKRISELNIDFFNNMAHEFRTPITNINLSMKMLSKQHNELKENKYVQIVSRESKQLMQQVERVLHLAKLEEGDYQLRMEEINLELLLNKVIQDMDLQINQKGAQVSLNVDGQIPSIKGDQFHLSNAFRNIIDNALKYSQNSPEIRIHIEQTLNGVKLLFQDNGIGISKADQEIIFDKFQRIGTGNVHQQKGFGLGLSYVKKIVDLHQGAIKIFSELNQGSRFDLYIPIART